MMRHNLGKYLKVLIYIYGIEIQMADYNILSKNKTSKSSNSSLILSEIDQITRNLKEYHKGSFSFSFSFLSPFSSLLIFSIGN